MAKCSTLANSSWPANLVNFARLIFHLIYNTCESLCLLAFCFETVSCGFKSLRLPSVSTTTSMLIITTTTWPTTSTAKQKQRHFNDYTRQQESLMKKK